MKYRESVIMTGTKIGVKNSAYHDAKYRRRQVLTMSKTDWRRHNIRLKAVCVGLVLAVLTSISGICLHGREKKYASDFFPLSLSSLATAIHEAKVDEEQSKNFFLMTTELLESIFPDLRNCGVTIYAQQVQEFLSRHPKRTSSIEEANVIVFAPYLAWETNWPIYKGQKRNFFRQGDRCRKQPVQYAKSIIALRFAILQDNFKESIKPGLSFNDQKKNSKDHIKASRVKNSSGAEIRIEKEKNDQKVLLIDSSPFYNSEIAASYNDSDFIWAKLNILESRWRRNEDISMPPPPHQVIIPVAPLNALEKEIEAVESYERPSKEYFLTFKGNFATHSIRSTIAKLHNPDQGIIIVDSSTNSSSSWDFVDLMSKSEFTLAVRGDVEFSYRFTEAVCSGSIPVLVSDGWIAPFQSLVPFENYGIRISEDAVLDMVSTLLSVSKASRQKLQAEAQIVCQKYFGSVERQIHTMLELVLSD